MCLMFILSIVKNESTEEINLETIMGQSSDAEAQEVYSRIYGNDTYKRALKKWLPFINKRGFLDTLLTSDL